MTIFLSCMWNTKKQPLLAAFFAVVVRRIGMTKPPVKLGVGKNS